MKVRAPNAAWTFVTNAALLFESFGELDELLNDALDIQYLQKSAIHNVVTL